MSLNLIAIRGAAVKAGFFALGLGLFGLLGSVNGAQAGIYHSAAGTTPPGHRIQLEFSVTGAAATAREGEVRFKSNLMSTTAVITAWYVGDNRMRAILPAPSADASSVTYTLVARNPAGDVETSQAYSLTVSGPDVKYRKTARKLKVAAAQTYVARGYLPGFADRVAMNQGTTTLAARTPPKAPARPQVVAANNNLPSLKDTNDSTLTRIDDADSGPSPFYIEVAGGFHQVVGRDIPSLNATLDYDPGFEGSAAIGVHLGAGFRLAAEFSGGYTAFECCASDILFGSPAITLAYHFPRDWAVRPFIGFGGGWFFADYDLGGGLEASEDGPLALGEVGLSTSLTDTVEFFTGYRYSQAFVDDPFIDDIISHRARAGFRFDL
ncbi:MAG: hypothetical protein ACPG06_09820 [Alphaproteobacteria bacterium]